MKGKAKLQSQYCSDIDIKKICSFDYEIIEEKTTSLYHQAPRFLYIKKGRARLKVDTEVYEIGENCLVSILPWDRTEVVEVNETLQYEIIRYNYDIVANMVHSLSMEGENQMPLLKKFEEAVVLKLDANQQKEIETLFDKIKREVGVESVIEKIEYNPYYELVVSTLIVQLIAKFCRIAEHGKIYAKFEPEAEDNRAMILRYIYMHLSDRLTLDKLSKKFFMSKSAISKYISENTGLSFNELVNEMRVTKITNYLLYTDFTIEELANILGYVDAAHISKVFAARMDDKIGHYRKTYGKVLQVGNIEESKMDYKVVEYMLRSYAEDISAQSVADEFQISVVEVNKILMSQVECNFHEFLNRARINAASKLLLETDMEITDIAIEVGYNTVKTFRRNFLQLRGINPSEFRNNVKLDSN